MWHWPGKSLFKLTLFTLNTQSHTCNRNKELIPAWFTTATFTSVSFSFRHEAKKKNVSWHFRPGCFSHWRQQTKTSTEHYCFVFFLSGHSSVQFWLWFCSTWSCFASCSVTCVDDGTVRLETLISVCKNQLLSLLTFPELRSLFIVSVFFFLTFLF